MNKTNVKFQPQVLYLNSFRFSSFPFLLLFLYCVDLSMEIVEKSGRKVCKWYIKISPIMVKERRITECRAMDAEAWANGGPKRIRPPPWWAQRARLPSQQSQRTEYLATDNYSMALKLNLPYWVVILLGTCYPFIPSNFPPLEWKCLCYGCCTTVFWKQKTCFPQRGIHTLSLTHNWFRWFKWWYLRLFVLMIFRWDFRLQVNASMSYDFWGQCD